MTDSTTTATPWHLWAVGILSLLWNGYGCYDYYMTVTGGEEYLRAYGMTDAQIDYYNAMPSWLTGAWAIGVWGAALGSVLLLLRSKWALHAFVVSFAAFLVSVVYSYGFSDAAALTGATGMIMNGVITAACVFFIWYAHTMTERGVLR
jgi:hypothetical protein